MSWLEVQIETTRSAEIKNQLQIFGEYEVGIEAEVMIEIVTRIDVVIQTGSMIGLWFNTEKVCIKNDSGLAEWDSH